MQIIKKNTADIKGYDRNARTHSDEQVRQIANSISEFGFNNPILLDDTDTIIAGHGRLAHRPGRPKFLFCRCRAAYQGNNYQHQLRPAPGVAWQCQSAQQPKP